MHFLLFLSSMAFSATFSKSSFSYISTLLHSPARRIPFRIRVVKAEKSAEPASDQKLTETKTQEISTNSQRASSTSPPPKPKKPVYSMKKGQIVRVDKEKYLNSINIQQCNAELQKTSFGYGKADMNVSTYLLDIHLIIKVWTTYMKIGGRCWTFGYLRQESMR
ncbi:NAD(P)H-quinone oxidoreductase subunit O, chloroplastic isoform X2 [Coffea arabica]|uniref:NAD(P)H-quinone oxidoreductase subunit O, chloroplastic isoform X2 n=1 Tax=Coffea arabica TaxID=13443 RepID=A0A6P6T838_COFAR|nr:NAD(P)H-quinone oxidoreductase subunit O, chloroplastic-like isoform X2 [Coffea arabica]